jgi:hypothetical protein
LTPPFQKSSSTAAATPLSACNDTIAANLIPGSVEIDTMLQEYSKRCPNQIFRLLKKGISLRLESICEPNSLKCTKRQAKCSTVSPNACLARYIPNIWKIIVQINEFDSEKHYFIAYIVQINEFCPFFTQVVQNDEFGTSDGRATRARRPCHPRQTAVPPAPDGRATRARRPCHPHRPTRRRADPVAPIGWSSYLRQSPHNTHLRTVAQDCRTSTPSDCKQRPSVVQYKSTYASLQQ